MELKVPEARGIAGIGPPVARFAAMLISSLIALGSIAWALDVNIRFALNLYPAQYLAAVLALALPLAYIALPARRGSERTHVPWYDWVGAAVGFAAMAYLTVEYQRLVDLILLRPADGVAASVVTIVLALEALRRATGWALPTISVAFMVYALAGHVLPGRLGARPNDWESWSHWQRCVRCPLNTSEEGFHRDREERFALRPAKPHSSAPSGLLCSKPLSDSDLDAQVSLDAWGRTGMPGGESRVPESVTHPDASAGAV